MTRPPLGRFPLDRLGATRLQLHHAVQSLTAFAQALIDPMEDDRHRNFDWDVGVRGFRTRGAATAEDTTAVFLVEAFEVRIERDDAVLAVVPARGATIEGLRSALGQAALECVPGASGRPEFVAPEFDLPELPAGEADAPLDPDPAALRELASGFTHADLAVLRLADRTDARLETARVWPHHFDLGTLMHPEGGTVGIGLSPGDPTIPHPYWYVRGYPDTEAAPDSAPDELPTLEYGRWKYEGWTGAILESPELAALGSSGEEDAAVDHFLDVVTTTCVRLLA